MMSDINVVDLFIKQGVDWSYQATWIRDGETVDLTGWQGAVQIRSSVASPTVLLAANTSDDTMTLGDDGVVEFSFNHTVLNELAINPDVPIVTIDGISWLKIGVYDVRLTDTESVVMSFTQGDVYLTAGITQ